MRKKKPYIATLDQVKISRHGEESIIEYREPNVSTTYLNLGPEVQSMTNQEILDAHNQVLRVQQQMAIEYEHVAVEIPPGKPQIRHFSPGDQWVPRGDVLRCVIDDAGPDGEAVICIDEHELSLEEFGRLLLSYAGWGMRLVFVPDDEINEEPHIEVREAQES
jgi:hypothetical protein